MLKPIRRASCFRALESCQHLMRVFALWLCDEGIGEADITEAKIRVQMPSVIEGVWLWALLQREEDRKPLVECARHIADLLPQEKQALAAWVLAVSSVPLHFQSPPQTNLPTARPIPKLPWGQFKTLMLAFYSKGLHQIGLPYMDNGTPTNDAAQWLTYHRFREAFLQANRINPGITAIDICVLCGGPLTQPEVDHWIYEAAFPLLAVCADNLIPICGECNRAPNKGQKDVHEDGSFTHWFHPYLRQGNAVLRLGYSLPTLSVTCTVNSDSGTDQPKVDNLNNLLNLTDRWTRQLKATYLIKQDEIRRLERWRQQQGQPLITQTELQTCLQRDKSTMSPMEPHYEIRQLLLAAALEKPRLDAWQVELGLVP